MIYKQLILVSLLAVTGHGMMQARILNDFQCETAGFFCRDCGTLVMCIGESTIIPYEVRCGEKQVCGVTDTSASCFTESATEAEQCHCASNTGKKPDAFDISSYILCLPDGNQVSVPCNDDLIYDPEQFQCVTPPPTTTPFAPTCTETGFFPVLPACTSFFSCAPDNTGSLQASSVFECTTGERFDELQGKCVPEADLVPPEFQCSDDDGTQPDPVECNAFHICVGGNKLGATLCCEDDKKFDMKTGTCQDNVAEESCPKVGECVNMTDYTYACGDPTEAARGIRYDISLY